MVSIVPKLSLIVASIGLIVSLIGLYFIVANYKVNARPNVQMQIDKVIFDPNGPTEFYIEFRLANSGRATTLSGWDLSVTRGISILIKSFPPRGTFPAKFNPSSGQIEPPDDLSIRPLQSGEAKNCRFTWTYNGNAKEVLGSVGTIFYLMAFDVMGRKVAAAYKLSDNRVSDAQYQDRPRQWLHSITQRLTGH